MHHNHYSTFTWGIYTNNYRADIIYNEIKSHLQVDGYITIFPTD